MARTASSEYSASWVASSATPVACRRLRDWNLLSARSVAPPNSPSALPAVR